MSRNADGTFAHNNKGRPKGSRNKVTTEVKEKFETLLQSNLETFQSDLQTLKPYERVKVILELAKYVVPTLKATDVKVENERNTFNPIEITFNNQDNESK